MKITIRTLRHMAVVALASFGLTAWAATPTEIVKKHTHEIAALLKTPTAEGSPAHQRKKQKIQKLIRTFLAYDELAKRALWHHWEKRSKDEQKEFVELLRQLIEDRVLSNLSSQTEFTTEYGEATVQASQASVKTTIRIPNKPEIDIEYKMSRRGNRWKIYDLVTDGTSLVRNYRSQFNRIIQRDGYRALIQKMRDKLRSDSASGKVANAVQAG